MSKKDVGEAKKRLDKLVSKSRDQFYKPIQIAEILYQDRVGSSIDWNDVNTFRRQSTRWRNDMLVGLGRRPAVLNSRYEDQLFDSEVLPPAMLRILAQENRRGAGIVELYIYHQLLRRRKLVINVRDWLSNIESSQFSFDEFLMFFEHKGLKRNTDKAYEIAVYALFDVLVRRLEAQVSLSIPDKNTGLLKEFEDFAVLVLGLDTGNMSISQPARLYRVGATNAADAGLDMWANFGPAVQVKHMSLDLDQVGEIVGGLDAEHIVIVCRDTEEKVIDAVMHQTGVSDRVRGFVVHSDLVRWYSKCCNGEHADGLGNELVHDLLAQFDVEFRTNEIERVKEMFVEREYSTDSLTELWKVC